MNVLALFSRAEQLPYKIPCSQVQEVDKAVCLQKTDLAKDDVALPVNIHPCMLYYCSECKGKEPCLATHSMSAPRYKSSTAGLDSIFRSATMSQWSRSYLPTINAPATELATVHKVLNRTFSIKESLQLNSIICMFHQALYAKAAEIVWKHEKFKNIIIRMGIFHTICNLLSILGKRFQDAGLKDLCVQSGVIVKGSVTGVMEGRKYNRAVRLYKLVYEAMMRFAWKAFLPWLEA